MGTSSPHSPGEENPSQRLHMTHKNGIWSPCQAILSARYHGAIGVLNPHHPRFFHFFLSVAYVRPDGGPHAPFPFVDTASGLLVEPRVALPHGIYHHSRPVHANSSDTHKISIHSAYIEFLWEVQYPHFRPCKKPEERVYWTKYIVLGFRLCTVVPKKARSCYFGPSIFHRPFPKSGHIQSLRINPASRRKRTKFKAKGIYTKIGGSKSNRRVFSYRQIWVLPISLLLGPVLTGGDIQKRWQR